MGEEEADILAISLMALQCVCADVEFGRLQARDLLQHLWTGPISNAPVDIVQGSKSVEVRPVGFSKARTLFLGQVQIPDTSIWCSFAKAEQQQKQRKRFLSRHVISWVLPLVFKEESPEFLCFGAGLGNAAHSGADGGGPHGLGVDGL